VTVHRPERWVPRLTQEHCQGLSARDPVDGEVVNVLEPSERAFGVQAEMAVDRQDRTASAEEELKDRHVEARGMSMKNARAKPRPPEHPE
jgi:hypothetical protein